MACDGRDAVPQWLHVGPRQRRAVRGGLVIVWGRRMLEILLAVLCVPPLVVLMIIWHEIGHTVVAWLMGDWRATFVLYRRTASSTCIGCNLYDSQRLGPLANVAVNLGGVLFTAMLTWLAILLLHAQGSWRTLPRWLLVELAVIPWAGDLVWQVVQSLLLGVPPAEPVGWGIGYTDFSAAGSFFAQATGWPRPLVEVIGIGCAVAYSLLTVVAFLRATQLPRTLRKPAPALR